MERRTGPLDPHGEGGRPAWFIVVAAALLIAATLFKPWGLPVRLELPGAAPRTAVPPGLTPTPTPTAAPLTDDTLVAPFCLQPSGWRVFAAERWSDRDVRSWRSAETLLGATGPGDPRIPITPLASQWVMSLGYCSPVAGPERPPPGATVTVYRLLDDATEPQVLPLRRLQPSLRASPLGAVYAPPTIWRATGGAPVFGPGSGPGSGWQSGTYIFQIGSSNHPPASWLGVRVELLPQPG
jgi:hypothetical protein